MNAHRGHYQSRDPGLVSLTLLLQLNGLSAAHEHIESRYGDTAIGVADMLRSARELGLKACSLKANWERLAGMPLPAIAALRGGGYMLLGRMVENGVLIMRPAKLQSEHLTREELEAEWDGRLVLIGRESLRRYRLRACFDLLTGRGLSLPRFDLSALGERLSNLRDRIPANLRERTPSDMSDYIHLLNNLGVRLFNAGVRARDWIQPPENNPVTAPHPANNDDAAPDESGLQALLIMLHMHGVSAEAGQVRHRMGTARIGIVEMLRFAKEIGLKASARMSAWDRLTATPLPAIAVLKGGGFLILGKAAADKVLIQRPAANRPEAMTRAEFEAIWDGRLVMMARRASLSDLSRRFDVTWFLGAVRKYRRLLSEVLIASFFLQLFALISPLFFQVVIDKVLVHQSISTLDVLVMGLVAISIFETILGILRTYLFAHTTNRIDVELGARLFRHLTALPLAYFQSRRVGDSVARVRELENIRQFLTSSALTLVIDLFFTFVFLAVMFYYSPLLTSIVLAAFPFYIAISAGATPIFRRRLDEKFRRGAENQSFLVESVTGIETLKAMAVEPQMQRRWEEQLAGYVAASFRVISLNNTASQTVQFINKLVTAFTLFFGAKLVISGGLSVGELVAFNMLASRVSAPVLRLAQLWQDFHQARLSIDRLGDILNTMPEPTSKPGRTTPPPIRGDITFDNVTFRYRIDGQTILRDVNFNIQAGQVIGVVGASGSGKSTLAKLLQRLYVPENGRVLVDGFDLSMVDTAWLRRQIGVVLQESILFNNSVRDNIALADPTMPMERIINAATLSGAHDFILDLPEGYDTVVGERGASLSGGQRQRIAIARALITDPRILIFDEATSALDYESERAIQQNMRQIVTGRTVFIIAHRLSTVRHADRIITIERGRVVEDGTHDDLIHSNGRYAALHRLQAGIQHVR